MREYARFLQSEVTTIAGFISVIRRIALLTALLLLAAPPCPSANLIANSGFESAGSTDNVPGWTFWRATWGSGGSAYTTTATRVSGNRALKLECYDCSFGVYQEVAVTAGKAYQMNGWWKGSFTAGQTAWFDCELLDGPFDLATADDPVLDRPYKIAMYDPAQASWNWEMMSNAYGNVPFVKNGIRVAAQGKMTVVLKTGGFWASHSIGYYDDITLEEVPTMSIPEARAQPDGRAVMLAGDVVVGAFPGFFYLQSPSRVAGIRVNASSYMLLTGRTAKVAGVLRTNPDGERYIDASYTASTGSCQVRPIAMSVKSLSTSENGPTPNTLGLLVRVCGRVQYVNPQTFILSDGSGAEVRCVTPSSITVSPSWTFASVAGVSSCVTTASGAERLLRVRGPADITVMLP